MPYLYAMVLFLLLALWIALITAGVLLTMFVVQMLADALQRKFPDGNEKIIWAAVITLTFGVGALVYYLTVKKKPVA